MEEKLMSCRARHGNPQGGSVTGPRLYVGCNLAGPRGQEKKMQTARQMEGERGKYTSQRTSERARTDIV